MKNQMRKEGEVLGHWACLMAIKHPETHEMSGRWGRSDSDVMNLAGLLKSSRCDDMGRLGNNRCQANWDHLQCTMPLKDRERQRQITVQRQLLQSENRFKKMGTEPEMRPIGTWEQPCTKMLLQSQRRTMCRWELFFKGNGLKVSYGWNGWFPPPWVGEPTEKSIYVLIEAAQIRLAFYYLAKCFVTLLHSPTLCSCPPLLINEQSPSPLVQVSWT